MGRLSIIGTPIGNLEDITIRALRTLKEADVIFCEDTRVTKKLLSRYEVETPVRRLDAHTEARGGKEIIDRLVLGEHVAYVTDAGTPGISDPGARLVATVRQALGDSFPIEPIPGPSALSAALSVAGVSGDNFLFLGFLPHKKGRQTALREIATVRRPVVLYESPHRILKLLRELGAATGERDVTVLRELTKAFESIHTGDPVRIADYLEEHKQARGEFVVIVHP
jgi:16S rRNA (cytidine1402-2'-O)-methyltransferase